MMLIMGFVSAAYVILCSINAGVSVSKAFYATYAGWSDIGNLLYLFEVLMIGGFQAWAFWKFVMVTWFGFEVWKQVDARVAEAATDSIGFETPISWELAIKTGTLTLLVGILIIVAGFSLGDIADEAISWVSYYDDDTNQEADDKNTSERDAYGTAAT
jgi:hypothetical protein